MKKNKFAFGSFLLSAVLAVLSVSLIDPTHLIPRQLTDERILWTGAFFALIYFAGWIGLVLGLKVFHRGYKVRFGVRGVSLAVALGIVTFIAGAFGQALYMRGEKQVIHHPSDIDMELLLDGSSSMELSNYDASLKDAAFQVVDSLDENCQMEIIGFANTIPNNTIPTSSFQSGDDAGKNALKDYINSIDVTGGTNFSQPLAAGTQFLKDEGRQNAGKAIVLLTDGDGAIEDKVLASIQSNHITLFAGFLSETDPTAESAEKLRQFASATGGTSVHLVPTADGPVDAGELTRAIQSVYTGVDETVTLTPDGLLPYTGGATAYQWFIRIMTLLVCALLAGIGYFGRISFPQILLNAASGLTLALCIYLFQDHYISAAVCAGVLLGTAVVTLRIAEENTSNV